MPADILGPHPPRGTWVGDLWDHADARTPQDAPHRALSNRNGAFPAALTPLRAALVTHHASAAQLAKTVAAQQAFTRLGRPIPKTLRRFPVDDSTRKGNFAEIVLAEYVTAASSVMLPVYRLRYNPNVDQSMKGDDVLAFDLDADPVRVVVGEAKFRKTSTDKVVSEIVTALEKSNAVGVPASLQFVADEIHDSAIAECVMACARLFAENKIRVDYVGMLVSDANAASRIALHAPTTLRRLLFISWGFDDPDTLVDTCFDGLA